MYLTPGEQFSGTYYLGYWNNSHNSSPQFPMPVEGSSTPEDRVTAIKVLKLIELAAQSSYFKTSDLTIHAVGYRGWTTCRICGCKNGSEEFEICVHSSSFGKFIIIIPEGYLHYIEHHNVQPDMRLISVIQELLASS